MILWSWDYVELQCEDSQASSCLNITDDKTDRSLCTEVKLARVVGKSGRPGIANRDPTLQKVSSSPIIKHTFDYFLGVHVQSLTAHCVNNSKWWTLGWFQCSGFEFCLLL